MSECTDLSLSQAACLALGLQRNIYQNPAVAANISLDENEGVRLSFETTVDDVMHGEEDEEPPLWSSKYITVSHKLINETTNTLTIVQ